ncbi:hypothetical protein WA026_021476 [Henosepilachna vigintioctopunctata]|uniref:Ig-like domain-containing protein n=1 Tax=Henosepilachna vigintioctopunctata TaxID=420089 RepID=A0AAW1UIU8_9CUCU
MRIEWFHNGRPFATGSRVHQINDFGFISLDIDYTYARDAGEYICKATNKWGSAITKATVTSKSKRNIDFESQLPSGMTAEKLKELERGPVSVAPEEDKVFTKPKFITQIQSSTVEESETVHFECRVEPKDDPKLRIEWYRNGKPLPSGSRYKTVYDLGFVSLDISYFYSEDSGEYVCRAVNDHGEDFTRASVSCKKLPNIILQNQVPKGMKKSETLMQMEAAIKKYTSEIHLTEDDLYDIDKKQPPRFVTQIQDQTELVEMNTTKFECQLAPVGDPNMKVEWFFNGKPLPHKNRFTPIYDFGYVAMNFGWVYPEDSGEYLCRATNLYGQDETRAFIKTSGKPGIIYESQLPKGMKSIERIRELEAAWQNVPEEVEEESKPRSAPAFVSRPEPVTVQEGEWARFCCRVTGHPRPRVMWLVNGHTIVNGARYKLTFDGMYHMDIPKTRQYDTGKVEVIARSSVGEAIAETELKVIPRHDDYRNVLKNSPRPWYDLELSQYQKDRQDTELERIFDERNNSQREGGIQVPGVHVQPKEYKEPDTEWQQAVRSKKGSDYYNKLQTLENEQITKEIKLREGNHQFAIPGEKVVANSVAKGMAQKYQENLEKPEEHPHKVQLRKTEKGHQYISNEVEIDSKTGAYPPEPTESAVHGREVHVTKQKQTQKERHGDLEITRNITATETTDVEHVAKTQEKLVQGQVLPCNPPHFTKKIKPCRTFENDSAKFEVEFDGDPLPKITWYREDFPITSSPDLKIYTFSTKSILQIRQVFLEDSGVFSVVAENRGGTAKCSANLVVQERRRAGRTGPIPPSFVTTIQSITAPTGQLVRFDARINGTKPIDVYWLKNGKKIIPDIKYKTLEEDEIYTLLILEVTPEDSGKIECVAINTSGEARCEAECLVHTPSSPSKSAKPSTPGAEKVPTVLEPLKDQTIREGQSAAFRCKISGKPLPTIKWQKGDKDIKPSKYFQMMKEGDICILKISEAFPEDEGSYTCLATNPAGTVKTQANLKVLAPETQEVPPSLTPMKDVIVSEGSPAQFKSKVSGKPKPTIQWLRDGFLIPASPDFQMIHEGNNVVLLISTTYEEDSGTFTCRATSSAGQVEQSAKLIVKKRTDAYRKLPESDHKLQGQISDGVHPKDSYGFPSTTAERSEKSTSVFKGPQQPRDEHELPVGDETLPWRKKRIIRKHSGAFEIQQQSKTQALPWTEEKITLKKTQKREARKLLSEKVEIKDLMPKLVQSTIVDEHSNKTISNTKFHTTEDSELLSIGDDETLGRKTYKDERNLRRSTKKKTDIQTDDSTKQDIEHVENIVGDVSKLKTNQITKESNELKTTRRFPFHTEEDTTLLTREESEVSIRDDKVTEKNWRKTRRSEQRQGEIRPCDETVKTLAEPSRTTDESPNVDKPTASEKPRQPILKENDSEKSKPWTEEKISLKKTDKRNRNEKTEASENLQRILKTQLLRQIPNEEMETKLQQNDEEETPYTEESKTEPTRTFPRLTEEDKTILAINEKITERKIVEAKPWRKPEHEIKPEQEISVYEGVLEENAAPTKSVLTKDRATELETMPKASKVPWAKTEVTLRKTQLGSKNTEKNVIEEIEPINLSKDVEKFEKPIRPYEKDEKPRPVQPKLEVYQQLNEQDKTILNIDEQLTEDQPVEAKTWRRPKQEIKPKELVLKEENMDLQTNATEEKVQEIPKTKPKLAKKQTTPEDIPSENKPSSLPWAKTNVALRKTKLDTKYTEKDVNEEREQPNVRGDKRTETQTVSKISREDIKLETPATNKDVIPMKVFPLHYEDDKSVLNIEEKTTESQNVAHKSWHTAKPEIKPQQLVPEQETSDFIIPQSITHATKPLISESEDKDYPQTEQMEKIPLTVEDKTLLAKHEPEEATKEKKLIQKSWLKRKEIEEKVRDEITEPETVKSNKIQPNRNIKTEEPILTEVQQKGLDKNNLLNEEAIPTKKPLPWVKEKVIKTKTSKITNKSEKTNETVELIPTEKISNLDEETSSDLENKLNEKSNEKKLSRSIEMKAEVTQEEPWNKQKIILRKAEKFRKEQTAEKLSIPQLKPVKKHGVIENEEFIVKSTDIPKQLLGKNYLPETSLAESIEVHPTETNELPERFTPCISEEELGIPMSVEVIQLETVTEVQDTVILKVDGENVGKPTQIEKDKNEENKMKVTPRKPEKIDERKEEFKLKPISGKLSDKNIQKTSRKSALEDKSQTSQTTGELVKMEQSHEYKEATIVNINDNENIPLKIQHTEQYPVKDIPDSNEKEEEKNTTETPKNEKYNIKEEGVSPKITTSLEETLKEKSWPRGKRLPKERTDEKSIILKPFSKKLPDISNEFIRMEDSAKYEEATVVHINEHEHKPLKKEKKVEEYVHKVAEIDITQPIEAAPESIPEQLHETKEEEIEVNEGIGIEVIVEKKSWHRGKKSREAKPEKTEECVVEQPIEATPVLITEQSPETEAKDKFRVGVEVKSWKRGKKLHDDKIEIVEEYAMQPMEATPQIQLPEQIPETTEEDKTEIIVQEKSWRRAQKLPKDKIEIVEELDIERPIDYVLEEVPEQLPETKGKEITEIIVEKKSWRRGKKVQQDKIEKVEEYDITQPIEGIPQALAEQIPETKEEGKNEVTVQEKSWRRGQKLPKDEIKRVEELDIEQPIDYVLEEVPEQSPETKEDTTKIIVEKKSWRRGKKVQQDKIEKVEGYDITQPIEGIPQALAEKMPETKEEGKTEVTVQEKSWRRGQKLPKDEIKRVEELDIEQPIDYVLEEVPEQLPETKGKEITEIIVEKKSWRRGKKVQQDKIDKVEEYDITQPVEATPQTLPEQIPETTEEGKTEVIVQEKSWRKGQKLPKDKIETVEELDIERPIDYVLEEVPEQLPETKEDTTKIIVEKKSWRRSKKVQQDKIEKVEEYDITQPIEATPQTVPEQIPETKEEGKTEVIVQEKSWRRGQKLPKDEIEKVEELDIEQPIQAVLEKLPEQLSETKEDRTKIIVEEKSWRRGKKSQKDKIEKVEEYDINQPIEATSETIPEQLPETKEESETKVMVEKKSWRRSRKSQQDNIERVEEYAIIQPMEATQQTLPEQIPETGIEDKSEVNVEEKPRRKGEQLRIDKIEIVEGYDIEQPIEAIVEKVPEKLPETKEQVETKIIVEEKSWRRGKKLQQNKIEKVVEYDIKQPIDTTPERVPEQSPETKEDDEIKVTVEKRSWRRGKKLQKDKIERIEEFDIKQPMEATPEMIPEQLVETFEEYDVEQPIDTTPERVPEQSPETKEDDEIKVTVEKRSWRRSKKLQKDKIERIEEFDIKQPMDATPEIIPEQLVGLKSEEKFDEEIRQEVISTEKTPLQKTEITKPVDEIESIESLVHSLDEVKSELIPTKITDDISAEALIVEEPALKSVAEITLVEKKEPEREQQISTDKIPTQEVNKLYKKNIKVDVISKKKIQERQIIKFSDDGQPLPELEIISQKKITVLPEVDVITSEIKDYEKVPKAKTIKPMPPKFVKKIEPVSAELKKPTRFTCIVDGSPFPTIEWYKNEVLIDITNRVYVNIVENSVTLEFETVEAQDEGIYSCRASNCAGHATTTANLIVLEEEDLGMAPSFIEPLISQPAEEDSSFILKCKIVGQPKPDIKWLHNEKEVIPDSKKKTSYHPETGVAVLELLEAVTDEVSSFRIIAENEFGRAQSRITISEKRSPSIQTQQILEAPEIIKPVQSIVTKPTEEVVLNAEFKAVPAPKIEWFRNGKPIMNDDNYLITKRTNETELRIKRTAKQKGGKYEVKVANKVGEARSSSTVTVTEEKLNAEAPKFIKPIKPQFVCEGEVVILESVIEAFPTASFQWFQQSIPISSSNEMKIVSEDNKSTLIITEMSPELSGTITCRAENVAGSVTSTATIGIIDDTDWTEKVFEYPRFLEKIMPVRVMDGEEVKFSCIIAGKPTPKVEWYHNDKPIVEAKDVIVSQNADGICELKIAEVFPENAGEYICKAKNKVGEAICKTILAVEAYEYIPDSEMGHFTGSEEDLLDKTLSEAELQSDSDVECAPKIIKKLPEFISTKDGDVTKLEVQVIGNPKPKGRWLKHGEEVVPSNEFVIDEFDNGISILTISEVYPDDTGEIIYEALNPHGVAVTSTNLLVESVEGILGTKEYRKPDWVTHMEELQVALKESRAPPTFVKELTDIRTTEAETVTFECLFSGTPTPDIIWYHNDKIIRNTENVKIRILETKTTCTIKEASKNEVGQYVCKAVSDTGLAITKAKLYVQEIPEYKKKEILIRKAKEIKETVKKEKLKMEEKKEARKKAKASVTITEVTEKTPTTITEIQTTEETNEMLPGIKAEEARPILDIQEPLSTEAIASCKKIPDAEEIEETLVSAETSFNTEKSVITEQTIIDENVTKLLESKTKSEKARVEIQEIVSREFANITEVKLEEIIERVENIIKKGEIKMAKEVTELLDFLDAKQFGPGEQPLKEIAEIGYLVKNGISVREITVLYQENRFPSLKTPQAQSALVNVVERKGYGSLISEVLTEETAVDESKLAATVGFRAFMKMVEADYVTIEEVITNFIPEDFISRAWESTEVSEEIVKPTFKEMVTISEEIEVHEDKEYAVKRRVIDKKEIKKEILEDDEGPKRATIQEIEQKKNEESVIEKLSADEGSIKKVTKTKRSRKTDKSEKDEEIETSQTIISKESTRVFKPSLPKDISFSDEIINPLTIEEAPTSKILPIQISKAISEATVTSLVTQNEEIVPKSSANVQIIPYKALIEKEVLTTEHEEDKKFDRYTPSKARQSVDTIETYQTEEQLSQIIPELFETTFKPTTSQATQDIITSKNITVEEVNTTELPESFSKKQTDAFRADVTVLEQEAPTISETQFEMRECGLETFSLPTKSKANYDFSVNTSINIEEVIEADREDTYYCTQASSAVSNTDIEPMESIVVEEVRTEMKPNKFLPESFVPTEIAYERVIPNKSITQTEMFIPENAGDIKLNRVPATQNADLQFVTKQGIIASENPSHYKEGTLESFTSSSTKATQDITLLESVTVSTVDSLIPELNLEASTFDTKTAEVLISPRDSVMTTTNTIVESEEPFSPSDKTQTRRADVAITCLEVSNVSVTKVQESEDYLMPDNEPIKMIAEEKINSMEPIEICQVEIAETPNEFDDKIKFTTDTAKQSIDSHQVTNISIIQAAEKESDYSETQPIPHAAVETIINETKEEIQITESHIMEKETKLSPFEKPSEQKTKYITAHMLPTSMTEEVLAEYQASNLNENKPQIDIAKVTQSFLNETIVSETQSSESLGVHSVLETPISKTADISLRPVESVHIEEVIPQNKERIFTEQMKPDLQQAELGFLSQNVACSSVVQFQQTIGSLQDEIPEKSSADCRTNQLEHIQVIEYETAEKESNDLILDEAPSKLASVQLNSSKESVSVTEIFSGEKEKEYICEAGPMQFSAISNITAHDAVAHSEIIEPVAHASLIIEEELKTGKAKKITKPFEELIITETNVVDIEKHFTEDTMPEQKIACLEITPSQQVSVTEIIVSDKEKNLVCSQPLVSTAEMNIDGTNVAINETRNSKFILEFMRGTLRRNT